MVIHWMVKAEQNTAKSGTLERGITSFIWLYTFNIYPILKLLFLSPLSQLGYDYIMVGLPYKPLSMSVTLCGQLIVTLLGGEVMFFLVFSPLVKLLWCILTSAFSVQGTYFYFQYSSVEVECVT